MIKGFVVSVETVGEGRLATANALNAIEANGFRILSIVPMKNRGYTYLDVFAREIAEAVKAEPRSSTDGDILVGPSGQC